VPARAAAKLRRRYDEAIEMAFAGLPPGPPPRRKHTGGWAGYQRDAWNLAVRLRDRKAEVLRTVADTRAPWSNNQAEVNRPGSRGHSVVWFPAVPVSPAWPLCTTAWTTGAAFTG